MNEIEKRELKNREESLRSEIQTLGDFPELCSDFISNIKLKMKHFDSLEFWKREDEIKTAVEQLITLSKEVEKISGLFSSVIEKKKNENHKILHQIFGY